MFFPFAKRTHHSPARVLIRGVNWLGDAVMTTPALMSIREANPAAHITLLTHRKLAALWLGHPAIDHVETFAPEDSIWRIARHLRKGHHHLALTLPNSHRSAIELWLARIPIRIGYARTGRNFFLTKPVPPRSEEWPMRKRSDDEIKRLLANPSATPAVPPAQAHHIFHYLHLAQFLSGDPMARPPHIAVSEKECQTFSRRLPSAPGAKPILWCGINPGAEYGPAKRWPADRFVAAALQLHRSTGCGWIVFGVEDNATRAVATELEKHLPPTHYGNCAGQTTLRELCAGLKICHLVLTNDTGPMHVAAAVGTPVVVPFGSTSPELTAPGLPGVNGHALLSARVPCSPCYRRECPIDFRCMLSIEVGPVVEACHQILSNSPSLAR